MLSFENLQGKTLPIDKLQIETVDEQLTLLIDCAWLSDNAFVNCPSLTKINSAGTMAQWEILAKGEYWRQDSSISQVICFDGTVSLS